MSAADFEQWREAKERRDAAAYLIAKAAVAGVEPHANDVETFVAAEALMVSLEPSIIEDIQ